MVKKYYKIHTYIDFYSYTTSEHQNIHDIQRNLQINSIVFLFLWKNFTKSVKNYSKKFVGNIVLYVKTIPHLSLNK